MEGKRIYETPESLVFSSELERTVLSGLNGGTQDYESGSLDEDD